jgi:hypothetical protein
MRVVASMVRGGPARPGGSAWRASGTWRAAGACFAKRRGRRIGGAAIGEGVEACARGRRRGRGVEAAPPCAARRRRPGLV